MCRSCFRTRLRHRRDTERTSGNSVRTADSNGPGLVVAKPPPYLRGYSIAPHSSHRRAHQRSSIDCPGDHARATSRITLTASGQSKAQSLLTWVSQEISNAQKSSPKLDLSCARQNSCVSRKQPQRWMYVGNQVCDLRADRLVGRATLRRRMHVQLDGAVGRCNSLLPLHVIC